MTSKKPVNGTATNFSDPWKPSEDSEILYNYLGSVEIGTQLTYAEIGAAIGRDIDGGSPLLQSVKRKLEKDGVFFDTIRGVGIRRSDAEGTADAGDSRMKRGVRAMKRAGHAYAVIDHAKLKPERRVEVGARLAVLSIVERATAKKALGALKKEVVKRGEQLNREQAMSLIQDIKR